MSERNISFLLQDIVESIENILSFTRGFDLDTYSNDLRTQHAVQLNFMIIGEAVSRIPADFKSKNNSINWRQVKDFRNVIVHEYFGIDNSIVWNIIRNSLPLLLEQIVALLKEDNM